MNDANRKILTEEVLGECWHEFTVRSANEPPFGGHTMSCRCGAVRSNAVYRSFTTPQDMVDVEKAIVKMKEWDLFHLFAWDKYNGFENETEFLDYDPDYTLWLFDPPRFCNLSLEWWKERRK